VVEQTLQGWGSRVEACFPGSNIDVSGARRCGLFISFLKLTVSVRQWSTDSTPFGHGGNGVQTPNGDATSFMVALLL